MIITLTKADFSASNIGTLSTWSILKTLGTGATSSNTATSVNRGAAYSTTITIADGYELGSAGVTVTMGGTAVTPTISGNTITISIASVTGNVVIKVPTVSTGGGEAELVWHTSAVKSSAGTFPPANLALEGSGFTYYNEATHDKYQGKTVNRIAFIPTAAGTLTIYKTDKITSGATGTVVATVSVKAEDTGTYTVYELPDIAVGANEYIAVYKHGTDTAKFKYWNVASAYTGVEDQGMILCSIDGSYITSEKGACGFDLGYYG